jgi:hypothetical protein
MFTKKINITIIVFLILQLFKPFVIIFFYKEITDFHPTIVDNYDLYFMIWDYIFQGIMKLSYTLWILFAEILFLIVPWMVYKKLAGEK